MCSEASFQILILPFFLSTLVICSTLEKHFLKTTFSHLKNTKKVSDTFFPFAVLELQKQPKGSFIKYVKICAESWGFICQELDCSEFLLQLILTPRERKRAGDPGPLRHGRASQHLLPDDSSTNENQLLVIHCWIIQSPPRFVSFPSQ